MTQENTINQTHRKYSNRRPNLQLTQTRQIQRRPIEQIQRLPDPTAPRRPAAIIRAVEQRLQIGPLLIHNLVQEVRPVGSRTGQGETVRDGRGFAVEDGGAAVVVGRADVVGSKGAVVARDGARDVGYGHALDGEGGPLVGRHGGGEDEGAEAEGEDVGGGGQGEVVGAREEAVGGEAVERGHVGHDGGEAGCDLGGEVLVQLPEGAV